MRNDIYMCDCDCKKKYFSALKDAQEHNNKKHDGSKNLYYNAPYGVPFLLNQRREKK